MKKRNLEIRDLVYVHINENSQYVLSYGIEFSEFVQSIPRELNNLLLLKHRYEDGEFNRHTMLDYIPSNKVEKLAKENVYGYGHFCWIDFEEKDGVDELSGTEIAELLYLGHIKQHLRSPFYSRLGNRYVYLAHDDGWFNKTYYRNINDFYRMLGSSIALKLGELKLEKTLLGIRKKRTYPSISMDILLSLSKFMREGMVFSLQNAERSRNRIEIPIWVIGDFDSMDDMVEEFEQLNKDHCDAKLIFDKKTREWAIVAQ